MLRVVIAAHRLVSETWSALTGVRAVIGPGVQPSSAPALATTVTFNDTDSSLAGGLLKAAHLQEVCDRLRQ